MFIYSHKTIIELDSYNREYVPYMYVYTWQKMILVKFDLIL